MLRGPHRVNEPEGRRGPRGPDFTRVGQRPPRAGVRARQRFLVVLWAMTTGPTGFFWPVFPVLGWGIGLAFHVWEVVSPEPSEEKIRAEMERLRRR